MILKCSGNKHVLIKLRLQDRTSKQWNRDVKWSHLSTVIGLPVGILIVALEIIPFIQPDSMKKTKFNHVLFQAAQELRYNHNWLCELSFAVENGLEVLPTGFLKSEGLVALANRYYQQITAYAYGERKHIYQEMPGCWNESWRDGWFFYCYVLGIKSIKG